MTDVAAQAASRRPRRAGGWSLVLWIFAAILLLCQAVIWYQPETPALAVLDQLAIQLAGLALCGALLALALRRWIPLVAMAVLAATLSWPVFAGHGDAAVVTSPERLRILSANLWARAPGHDRTLETLMASDADIIGLVEVTPQWLSAHVRLQSLQALCQYLPRCRPVRARPADT